MNFYLGTRFLWQKNEPLIIQGFQREIASSTMQVLENDEEKEFIQVCLCTKQVNQCLYG